MADATGQPLDKIEEDTDRDFFMTPEEAQEYGIIDEVPLSLTGFLSRVLPSPLDRSTLTLFNDSLCSLSSLLWSSVVCGIFSKFPSGCSVFKKVVETYLVVFEPCQ